jgi:two-component system NarL family sensor kinase
MPAIKPEIVQFIAWGTVMFSLLGIFIIIFILYYRKRHTAFHRQEQQFQETLLRTQLEIQEQTMQHISEEIHDNVGQLLSLAKLNLATAGDEASTVRDDKIRDSKDLVSKAIRDLRQLSHSLNTDHITEIGIAKAIERTLDQIKKTGEVDTHFNVLGQPFELEEKRQLIVFRMVQETLNNMLNHAKAKLITVTLKFSENLLTLTITDDGIGCDLRSLGADDRPAAGVGIKNMNNRAKLIGATFKMTSTLGEGTTTTITIPQFNTYTQP